MLIPTEQTDFSAGEIDPTLYGQTNIGAYAKGAKRVRNCSFRATGGLERRFGTYDLAGLAARGRLEGFEFSSDQRYVLFFAPGALHVYGLDGTLYCSVAGCPWNATTLLEMTTTQARDVMVIAHQAFWPRVLRRTGPTTFVVDLLTFDEAIDGVRVHQPYYKFADVDATMKASAATGAVTLQCNKPIFSAAWVGQRIRLYDAEVEITAVTDSTHASGTVLNELVGRLDLDPLKTRKDTTKVEVLHVFHGLATGASVTLGGCNSVGYIPGDQIDGTRTVKVIDEHHYEITLTGVSFDYDDDGDSTTPPITRTTAVTSEDGGGPNVTFSIAGHPTRTWLEPLFSVTRGYPGACCFHDGRLWLGGSTSVPDAVVSSKALTPFNFDVGKGYDGDSVQSIAGSEDVSRIMHIVSNGDLVLLSALRESVFEVREGEPITPNNARVRNHSDTGTGFIEPCIYDGAILFVHENGLAVSEFVWSDTERRFRATAVSTLAGHLVRNPLALAAGKGTTTRAESLCYMVNADGTVAIFYSNRAENRAGWGLWTMGRGEVFACCTIGPYVFFGVERDGQHRLYRLTDNDIDCLDGCVRHVSVTPRTDWPLDARLANRTVGLRSELGYHGEVTLGPDPSVTLDIAVSTLVVGDPFYFEIVPLPPVAQVPGGTTTNEIRRICQSIVHFHETQSATVGGQPLETRGANEDRAAPISPVTGPRVFGHLGFSREPEVATISQIEPLPACVLHLKQKVKI